MNHRTIFAIVLSLAASLARADGLQDLETFLREVKSAQASFTQVVTSPKREGEATVRSKTSSGRFEFQRPGRFRFEYTKPFEQTIVADGQTLWLYDVDLNQVTARKQQDALGSTPAALIASGTDLKALGEVFELKAAPAAVQDVFGKAAPHGGRLLQPVAGKAVDQIEVRQIGMRAEDRVLIERVIGVMAHPVPHHLDRVKARRAVPEGGPDHILPEGQVGVEIIGRTGAVILRHGGGDPAQGRPPGRRLHGRAAGRTGQGLFGQKPARR